MSLGAQGQELLNKLAIFLILIAGLVVSVLLAVSISDGSYTLALLVIFFIIGLAWVLICGSNYWLILPLAFSLTIPALPVGGRALEVPELVTMACFCIFLARLALSKQGFYPLRLEYAFVTLYFLWVAFIYMQNPVGLLLFGSGSGGARFYFQLTLALLSVVILSSQVINQRQAQLTAFAILGGSIITAGYEISNFILSGKSIVSNFERDQFDSWNNNFVTPAWMAMGYLLGRFKISQIISLRYWYLPIIFIFILFVGVQSGRRAGFAALLAMPIIACVIRKEYLYAVLGVTLASVAIAILVLGHGTLFELPKRVQRVFVNIPGNWDSEVRDSVGMNFSDPGVIDGFRAAMFAKAIEKIKENPWVGEGFNINTTEFNRLLVGQGSSVQGYVQIEMLAQSSSWHNVWLAMAADFGIPAAGIYALFYIQVLFLLYLLYQKYPFGSHVHTLIIMIGLFFIARIMTSYNGGHSTVTPYTEWWMFGMLVSLHYTWKKETQNDSNKISNEKNLIR